MVLTSKHIIEGHPWPTSKMPFEWHFAGGPIVAEFVCWLGMEFLVILSAMEQKKKYIFLVTFNC